MSSRGLAHPVHKPSAYPKVINTINFKTDKLDKSDGVKFILKVYARLVLAGKVPAGRMQAVSFGESQPVESNDTARGRATNRRIEIEINY